MLSNILVNRIHTRHCIHPSSPWRSYGILLSQPQSDYSVEVVAIVSSHLVQYSMFGSRGARSFIVIAFLAKAHHTGVFSNEYCSPLDAGPECKRCCAKAYAADRQVKRDEVRLRRCNTHIGGLGQVEHMAGSRGSPAPAACLRRTRNPRLNRSELDAKGL